jgi:hypothetical protein
MDVKFWGKYSYVDPGGAKEMGDLEYYTERSFVIYTGYLPFLW